MRIAMVSTPFISVPPRDYGGTELVVSVLTEGLVARGHDVTLFATGDSCTAAELRYLYADAVWPGSPLDELNHLSWAMREIRSDHFDAVHVHAAGALAFGRLLPTAPMVYTLHHVRDEPLSEFYRWFPEADYIAISAEQRRKECALPRTTVIHHGLDETRYQCGDTPADSVLFIGRFAEIKGLHTAIDAAGRAGVPIDVGGRIHPADQEYGEREVEPRLCLDHVRYHGPVGMDVKVPLLRDARALLMPIEWDEPFGLVMIEAMLSGCPVVAFERGSVGEVVEEGRTGFVVEGMKEMAEAIRPGGPVDSFDRRACRQRAVERFGHDRMVREHVALYRRLAERRREARRVEPARRRSRSRARALGPGT